MSNKCVPALLLFLFLLGSVFAQQGVIRPRRIIMKENPDTSLNLDMRAGDDIDDLLFVRFLDNSGTDGVQLSYDQTAGSETFRLQDFAGVDMFTVHRPTGNFSIFGKANQTHILFVGAGDDIDDDVQLKLVNASNTNGYQFTFDQSLDALVIEDQAGVNALVINPSAVAVQFSLDLDPTSSVRDVGSIGNRWDDFVGTDLDITGEFRGGAQFNMDLRPVGVQTVGISTDRWNKGWFTDLDISGTCTGCGSGAPVGAPYVTHAADATLTNEKTLTAGTAIDVVFGASTATVDFDSTEVNATNWGTGSLPSFVWGFEVVGTPDPALRFMAGEVLFSLDTDLVINSGGQLHTLGTLPVRADGGFQDGTNTGIDVTCSGGNVLQNIQVSGGIIVAGTCVAN